MLAPDSIKVPVPDLVKVPDVVPMMLAILTLPGPETVRPNVLPVIIPVLLRVISPAAALITAAEPNLTRPAYEAALEPLFINAPLEEIPEPLMVSVPILLTVLPLKSSAAPVATVTAPEPVPNAEELPRITLPALIVVPPE